MIFFCEINLLKILGGNYIILLWKRIDLFILILFRYKIRLIFFYNDWVFELNCSQNFMFNVNDVFCVYQSNCFFYGDIIIIVICDFIMVVWVYKK